MSAKVCQRFLYSLPTLVNAKIRASDIDLPLLFFLGRRNCLVQAQEIRLQDGQHSDSRFTTELHVSQSNYDCEVYGQGINMVVRLMSKDTLSVFW